MTRTAVLPAPVFIDLPKQAGDRFHVERILLERARFSGRGDFGTDFRISSYTDGADLPSRLLKIALKMA